MPATTFPLASDPQVPAWKRHLLIPAIAALPPLVGLAWARQYTAAVVASAALGSLTYYLLRRLDGSRRVTFTLARGRLEVRGDAFADSFFLSEFDFAKAEVLDLTRDRSRALRWKTLGTGLPGYYSGEYTLANGENAVVFISDKSRVLYLPRKAQPSLLLSVAEPDKVKACLEAAAAAPTK